MKKIANKGFTLIELLVVIAIIAILALVVLLALNPVEMARKARDSGRLSDMGALRRAIDLSLADGQTLKATAGTDWLPLTFGTSIDAVDGGTLSLKKYLPVVPQDPAYTIASQYVQALDCKAVASAVNGMVYQFRSDGTSYVIRTHLESTDNCNAIKNDGRSSDYYETGTAAGLNL